MAAVGSLERGCTERDLGGRPLEAIGRCLGGIGQQDGQRIERQHVRVRPGRRARPPIAERAFAEVGSSFSRAVGKIARRIGIEAIDVAGMFQAIQCRKSPASGSRMVSRYATVPSGSPDQASGGETSLPSQVKRDGMSPPSAKAELDRVKRPGGCVVGVGTMALPFGVVTVAVGESAVSLAVGGATAVELAGTPPQAATSRATTIRHPRVRTKAS